MKIIHNGAWKDIIYRHTRTKINMSAFYTSDEVAKWMEAVRRLICDDDELKRAFDALARHFEEEVTNSPSFGGIADAHLEQIAGLLKKGQKENREEILGLCKRRYKSAEIETCDIVNDYNIQVEGMISASLEKLHK